MNGVVVYGFLEAVDCKGRRRLLFEAKLMSRGGERRFKDNMQSMFKYFADDWGYGVQVALVSYP